MGLMRFIVCLPECATEDAVAQACLSGIDGFVWQSKAELRGDRLVLRRAVSDSGSLQIPWDVEGHGRLMLSTGTLSEEFGPHLLPLELARGTLGQLRSQLADWQMMALAVPPRVGKMAAEATHDFSRAAVSRDERTASAELAQRALQRALDAGELLAAAYAGQVLAVRRRGGTRLGTFLGGDLGNSPLEEDVAGPFLGAFNAAVVPANWREIEAGEGSRYWTLTDQQIRWCKSHGLKVCCGPLPLFDSRGLPDWLYLFEDDFDELLSLTSDFVRATVERYRGQVDTWLCAGRLNSSDTLALSDDRKLHLAARCIELVRSLDRDVPAVLSLDQPWGEYTAHKETDFPPLHFADALVQAGLDPTGLALEINLGYHPGGTLPRDPLEFSRQLDTWSLLGLPLTVCLTVPSETYRDPGAERRVSLPQGRWSPQAQQGWMARYIPLLLAKPCVQAVLFNQIRDSEPHGFPHGGLFDAEKRPRPALRALATLRQACLR